MAVGQWKCFTRALRNLGKGGAGCGSGGITLGAGVFKMTLHRPSASANLLKVSNGGISTWASVTGEVSARGNYPVGGLAIAPAGGKWTVGSSTKAMKFTYTTIGVAIFPNGSTIQNVKYAVIRRSTAPLAGKVVFYCTLSTTAFNLNMLNPAAYRIFPHPDGVFF